MLGHVTGLPDVRGREFSAWQHHQHSALGRGHWTLL